MAVMDTMVKRKSEKLRRCIVDIHCHCLPNLDDGPATILESLALCRALVDDGINTVIATPHQLGRYSDGNYANRIRRGVYRLNEVLRRKKILLSIVPGADVRVDERICKLLEDGRILTLADGGKYILLELPHEILIEIEPLIIDLSSMGITAIISHPERHPGLVKKPDILSKWLECSAHVQVTAASLLGCFGSEAKRFAWQLLSSGWACLVATDSYNTDGRRPCTRAAFEQITDRLGESVAQLVCIENPLRVLKGQDVVVNRQWDTPKTLVSH